MQMNAGVRELLMHVAAARINTCVVHQAEAWLQQCYMKNGLYCITSKELNIDVMLTE